MPRREKVGTVVSDKMDKTCVVQIRDHEPHPQYKKIRLRTIKFKAHDPNNECKVGDLVRIVESRHYSKDKCWALKEIIQQSQEV